MALANGKTVAVALLHSLILTIYQGEPLRLQLIQQEGLYSPCFGQPVWLLCKLSGLTSEMFSTSRPSWREDGVVFSLDGKMYRSAPHNNQTHTFLELVPQRMHFEEMGSHNYTCFFHLLDGGTLESNPVQIRPIKELLPPTLMNAIEVNETSVKIIWDHSATCFEDCDITFNLTWTPSHQLQSGPKVGIESIEANATAHCITSLEPDTEYTATLTALCQKQSQATMASKTVVVTFRTSSDLVETESTSASSALPSPIPHNYLRSAGHDLDVRPAIIGGSVGVIFLFVAMLILIILLSTGIVMVRHRRMTSESLPQHNVKGHVYDTVSNITQAVQCQTNPCYTPMVQTAGTKVAMQENPAYITINDSTAQHL